MKTVLLLAILLGFGGTLAAAHLAPGIGHARLPSHTTVVANGGRSEQFLIHLPADRIAASDGETAGLRAATEAGAMPLPAKLASEPVLIEHFKIRDAGGNVIGVAARHWTTHAERAVTTWSVLVPSRGAFVLSAPGEARGSLETALRAAGYKAGSGWDGQAIVTMTPAGEPGAVAAGTGEFASLTGTYTESWTLAGIDETGKVHGTIELNTITSRAE
jgi:hypothetical protein